MVSSPLARTASGRPKEYGDPYTGVYTRSNTGTSETVYATADGGALVALKADSEQRRWQEQTGTAPAITYRQGSCNLLHTRRVVEVTLAGSGSSLTSVTSCTAAISRYFARVPARAICGPAMGAVFPISWSPPAWMR